MSSSSGVKRLGDPLSSGSAVKKSKTAGSSSAFPLPRNAGASISNRSSPAPGVGGYGGRVGAKGAGGDDDIQIYHAGIQDDSGKIKEYTNENDRCPVCKTDRYSKPTLRLLISPCYHKMCETCIDQLYTLGPQGCPQCGRILRKTNYVHQTFEDLVVEKEVNIRKRLAAIFNRTEQDFPDAKQYNNYLEMVEDITFNLIEGIDVPATEARIARWQKENESTIQANAEREREENERRRALEIEEKRERAEKMREAMQEEAELMRQIEEAKREAFEDIADGGDGKDSYLKLDRLKRELRESQASRDEGQGNKRNGTMGTRRYAASKHSKSQDNPAAANPLSVYYSGPFVALPYNEPRASKGFSILYLPMDRIVESLNDNKPGGSVRPLKDHEYEDQIRRTHFARPPHVDGDRVNGPLHRAAAGGFLLDDVWRREIFLAQDGLYLGL